MNSVETTTNRCDCNCSIQQVWDSKVERDILDSIGEPIEISESSEPIEINGNENCEIGIWANKHELRSWVGPIPIESYPINQDPNPEIINKKPNDIDCKREVLIKYLEPTDLPDPGKIIINQLPNIPAPPAPPVIIRQIPAIPTDPEPLVIREIPPKLPPKPADKIITIPGDLLPPPPRKLVIERLPELPTKPQDVILERWLPFKDQKRKIILNPKPEDPIQLIPKNIIVEWKRIECNSVKTEIKNLGVEKADPNKYVEQYGNTLMNAYEMPEIVNEVKEKHNHIQLAADQSNFKYYMELEGDIHALKLIDLEKEGLSEFKSYLENLEKRNEHIGLERPPIERISSSNIPASGVTSQAVSQAATATNSPSVTPATVNFNHTSSTFNTTTSTITNITPEIPPHPSEAKPISEYEEQVESLKSEPKISIKSDKDLEQLKTVNTADYSSPSNSTNSTILSKPSETLKQKSLGEFDKSTISEPVITDKPPLEQLKRSSVKFSDQQLDDLDRVVKTQPFDKTINDSGLNSEAINTSLIDIDQIEKDVNDNDKDNDKSELDVNKTEHLETEKFDEKSILESFELPKFSMSEIFELKQAFNLYDVEGTGYLRIQEIDSVLRSLGIFPTEQELQKMLNDIGASGNGKVSFEDFVSLMYAISIIAEIADEPNSECESKKIGFDRKDNNESNSSSSDILKSMLKSQRILVSEEEINDMLESEKIIESNRSDRRNLKIDIADANKYCTF